MTKAVNDCENLKKDFSSEAKGVLLQKVGQQHWRRRIDSSLQYSAGRIFSGFESLIFFPLFLNNKRTSAVTEVTFMIYKLRQPGSSSSAGYCGRSVIG